MMTTTMTPHPGGSSTAAGARFGVLIGLFVVCAFVLHNYVNLNIGLKLALEQAVAYFLQWTIVESSSVLFTDPSLHHNGEYICRRFASDDCD